ncbi:MAG: 2-methylaconitate cis-trans isomerase PrpF [Burkholderiales bacterium]
MSQSAIRATYMRGGTSKGVFFALDDLPAPARVPGPARDRLLLRVIGSPDPYAKHTDGMGGATSSTSKVVIAQRSARADCDVEFLFGAVAIDAPLIDWSGNCGNLTAAVGPFAIARELISAPADGAAVVRIWQANLGKLILARVPMRGGQVIETGDFELDGLPFPSAPIELEFLDAGGDGETGAMFPSGAVIDRLDLPGIGAIDATLINAGNPTVFVAASALGLTGTEHQARVNTDRDLLARCEALRAQAAVRMGLADTVAQASAERPATPKLCFVAPPAAYRASSGKAVAADHVDLLARILSMGQLHHAMTGTGAVAIAAAAAVPGTVVARAIGRPMQAETLRFGHPSGVFSLRATASESARGWQVESVVLWRSARRLMDGQVFVPTEDSPT